MREWWKSKCKQGLVTIGEIAHLHIIQPIGYISFPGTLQMKVLALNYFSEVRPPMGIVAHALVQLWLICIFQLHLKGTVLNLIVHAC
jgi:hypothetical protein